MQQQTTTKNQGKTTTPVAAMAFLHKGQQNKPQQKETTVETTAAAPTEKVKEVKPPKEVKFDQRKLADYSDDRLLKSKERTQARIDEARKAGKNTAKNDAKLVAIGAEITKRGLKQ